MIAKETTLDQRFLNYHKDNPHIYDELKKLCFKAKQNGRHKAGIGMMWEVMRWQRFLATRDPEGYKLNNSYRSRYARLIMENEKELEHFFDVRKLRTP